LGQVQSLPEVYEDAPRGRFKKRSWGLALNSSAAWPQLGEKKIHPAQTIQLCKIGNRVHLNDRPLPRGLFLKIFQNENLKISNIKWPNPARIQNQPDLEWILWVSFGRYLMTKQCKLRAIKVWKFLSPSLLVGVFAKTFSSKLSRY
jgi:hypothetical protein